MGLRRCKANETRRQSSRDPPKRRAACMTHSNCTVAVASRSFARSKLHQSAAAGFAITASAIYHAGIGQNTTSTSVRSVSLSVRAHDDISPAPLQSRWPLLHGTTQRQLPHSASKGASLTAKAMSAVSVPFDPSAAAALRRWGDGVQMRRSCSCHLARTFAPIFPRHASSIVNMQTAVAPPCPGETQASKSYHCHGTGTRG